MKRRWVGRWIMLVGAIHCVFGLIIFFEPLAGIVRDGIWNAVDGHAGRPLAFWFELLGLLTILFGAAIDQLEAQTNSFPDLMSYGFALLAVLGVVTMPVGGGWLLLPGAIGLLMKRRSAEPA